MLRAKALPAATSSKRLFAIAAAAGQAMTGVQLWLVLGGLAMVVHAGYGLMAEKQAALLVGEEVSAVSSQVFLEVVIGAAIALWGSIGEFKPIRISDTKKPRWESMHARPEFHCYSNRAKFLKPLIQSSLPPTPDKD